MIVCPDDKAALIRDNDERAALNHLHGIVPCGYEVGRHDVLADFCASLTSPDEEIPDAGNVVAADDMPRDPGYVRRRLLPIVDTEGDPQVALLLGHVKLIDEDGLADQARAIVTGVPGSGKTELLKRLAADPLPGERTVRVHLRNVWDVIGSPEALLQDWIRKADASFGTIDPQQAIDGEVRIHLLLDALDEQPPSRRQAAAGAIKRVGDAFPSIRMTVTSRWTAALNELPPEWLRYELLCDDAWAHDFLATRGTSRAELDARLGAAQKAVEPLLRIPFFLRRLTELTDEQLRCAVAAGDALSLILSLLDQTIKADRNLTLVASSLRSWLTDVAVRMQLTGRRSVVLRDLEPLSARYDDLGDATELTDWLVGRSLLEEGESRWSFAHRLFADALVAGALRDEDPAEWLDVVAPIAFGRSALREDWGAPFELLAWSSDGWRGEVAGRDPVAAARTTPPAAASRSERRSAIRTLWDRAHNLGVWLDDAMGGGHDDAATVGALLRAGELDADLLRFEQMLHSPSRYDRANALNVLLTADPTRAPTLIAPILAGEEDSTIRRNAASWAGQLDLTVVVDAVLARALDPEDDAEASDMASIALDLIEAEQRPAVARRILKAGNTKIIGHRTFDGAPPMDNVCWLRDQAQADPDTATFDLERQIVALLGSLDAISAADAAVVGETIALAHSSHPECVAWAAAHPAAAGGIVTALGSEFVDTHDVITLLIAVGSKALAAAGADDRTLEWVHAWEQAREQRAAAPPSDDEPMNSEPSPTGKTLSDVLALPPDERRSELLHRHRRRVREARAATIQMQAQIHGIIDDVWRERDLRAGVTLTETGSTVEPWAQLALIYGPATAFPLTDDRWVQTATCGALLGEPAAWLRSQANQKRLDSAADTAPPDARVLASLLTVAREPDLAIDSVIARIDSITSPTSEIHRGWLLHGPSRV